MSDRRTIAVSPAAWRPTATARADRIVALTEGIRDGIVAQGVSPARITLITNGVDLEHRRRGANGAEPAPRPGAAETTAFVAMYVGAHGTYSSLETVLDAADRLRGDRTCGSCWWAAATASRRWWRRRGGAAWTT